LLREAIGLKPM